MRQTLIIDLEATCSDDKRVLPRDEMEIIEVGAALATEDGDVVATLQRFVRPVEHPVLTTFCTQLTGITQADVANAPLWEVVAKELDEFARHHNVTEWGSWGRFDLNQIARECKRKKLRIPLAKIPHRNIRQEFSFAQEMFPKPGMKEAVERVGLVPRGAHHRALDDAINIAHLLPWCETIRVYRGDQ